MAWGIRGWALVGVVLTFLIVLAWAVWRGLETARLRGAVEEARADLDAGRPALAARKLQELLRVRPDSDEFHFLLGNAEKARGRLKEAERAWRAIPRDSGFAAPAIRALAAMSVDQGRLADAEQVIVDALGDPRVNGFELRRFLAPLYWQEGRVDEARRVIEENWDLLERAGTGGSELAVEHVRLHVALSVGMASIDAVRSFLSRAGQLAPGDDRVWLGKANLALRENAIEQAGQWLDRCLKIRPDDAAVWRARLDWGMAADRPDVVREAFNRLAEDSLPAVALGRTAAWSAARAGDAAAEAEALENLIAIDPENTAPLDRLAELAIKAGRPERALELRKKRAEIDQVRLRFQELFKRDQPVRDAVELARLATRLGRVFESRAYYAIALGTDPDLPEARSALAAPPVPPSMRGDTARFLRAEPPPRANAAREPAAAVRFDDSAPASGLKFTFNNGETSIHQIVEVSSGGIGVLDYDGDGWLDVYAIQGGPFPPPPDARPADRLFRNRGDGSFEDVTTKTGIDKIPGGYGHGVTVGDYDNDGRPDLFLTRWRSYTLLHNEGGARFRDVTARAGLAGDRDWPTSAAFADLDQDGDLDLYVCHYLNWDAIHPRLCKDPARGAYISCDPRTADALPDHLFRNDAGSFHDISKQAGITDADGRGFGVVAVDVDEDGLVDLYVANDMSENYLFKNLGGMRFEERGLAAGVACNAQGGRQAGMGVAAGDLDRDGKVDLLVTNFYNESTTFFHNLGECTFADHTSVSGLALASKTRLGFGIVLLDADNDGRLDLLTANGHVNDYRPEIPYQMPFQLLLGAEKGRLVDVSRQAGEPFQTPHIGRGVAACDLNNDGRVDAVAVLHGEPLVLLHNQTQAGHSITIQLEGTRSNRDGVGAKLELTTQAGRQSAWRTGGGSFLSTSDPRLHFGLGKEDRAQSLVVRWPSGQVDRFENLAAGKIYRIQEGSKTPVGIPDQPRR